MIAEFNNPTLAQLLSAAKAGQKPKESEAAQEYDWTRPCCFAAEPRRQLDQMAAEAAGKLSARLGEMLHQEMKLQAGVELCYFEKLLASEAKSSYAVPLADEAGRPGGLLLLPPATALGYIARLLGGKADGNEDRELSSLEAELLLDLVGGMADALASALPGKLKRAQGMAKLGTLPADTFCDICLLNFGQENKVAFSAILGCRTVEGMLGLAGAGRPAEETRKLLLGHLDLAWLRASAWLPQAVLRFQDALSLGGGDVVLLSGQASDPARLMVEDKLVAMGQLAVCDGNYALTITSRVSPDAGAAKGKR